MKKLIDVIPYFLIIFVSYISIAFVKADINTLNWDKSDRFAMILIILVVSAMYSLFLLLNKKNL